MQCPTFVEACASAGHALSPFQHPSAHGRDAVAPLPVLGGGGVGRGRQVAAAFALGCEGVWCGSVWLTTEEPETHPLVKEKFLQATSSDTVRSRSPFDHATRT